jgi:uncharacterized protein
MRHEPLSWQSLNFSDAEASSRSITRSQRRTSCERVLSQVASTHPVLLETWQRQPETSIEQIISPRQSNMLLGILLPILFLLAFNAVAMGVMIRLSPLLGLLWAIGLGGAFFAWHLRRGDDGLQLRKLIQLNGPQGSATSIAAIVGSFLVFQFGLSAWVTLLSPSVSASVKQSWLPLIEYQRTPVGWIAMAAMVVLVVPMVEEFLFRGRILRRLLGRLPTSRAVVTSAVLFSLLHVDRGNLAILSISLSLGVVAGLSAVAFRSIWVPVLLHAAWNLSMQIVPWFSGDSFSTFGVQPTWRLATIGLVGCAVGGVGLQRALHSYFATIQDSSTATGEGPASWPS